MNKTIKIFLSVFLLMGTLAGFYQSHFVKATGTPLQEDEMIQNHTYSTIDENGNVTIHEYKEEDNELMSVDSNEYRVVEKGNEDNVAAIFDTYEEASQAIEDRKEMRTFTEDETEYEVDVIADTQNIQYGVARILGFVSYTEYDGSAKGREGYTHGTSANDAAYLSTSADGKTIRVKQAGVVMDIPAEKVEVTQYSDQSKVSYYKGENGVFYHYYYSGSYGKEPNLNKTQVGFTPDYLVDNQIYYSYDGHYFYTDYKVMCDDYRANVHAYPKAVNALKPFYNYYQYLSLRSQTHFSAEDFNKLITDQKGEDTNSKLKDQGQPLLNNQAKYGINASLMLGVSINESAWGLSKFSQDRNNLFGIGAVDSNPDAALRFESVEACFNYFAYNTISAGYLDCIDYRYRGPHLGDKQSGINVKYASDPYWGEKAASFSYRLNEKTQNIDFQKYQLAISNVNVLNFYYNDQFNYDIYNSAAANKTNENVFNFPVTLLSESATTYKILSDSVLSDDRKDFNPDGEFNRERDYVFIKKHEVNKVGEVFVKTYLTGDVNGDGKVTSLDYIQIKNHIMKTKVLTDNPLIRADVNKDGKVTSLDYIKIKNHIMGTNPLF